MIVVGPYKHGLNVSYKLTEDYDCYLYCTFDGVIYPEFLMALATAKPVFVLLSGDRDKKIYFKGFPKAFMYVKDIRDIYFFYKKISDKIRLKTLKEQNDHLQFYKMHRLQNAGFYDRFLESHRKIH